MRCALTVLSVALAAGCYESPDTTWALDTGATASADTGAAREDVEQADDTTTMPDLTLTGDAGLSLPERTDYLAAVSLLSFTRETEEGSGIAPGFDVDGIISTGTDNESCKVEDFEGVDGTPGVDNQLATIAPVFDQVGIGAVEGLVQAAIEDGGLLIMLEFTGVDSLENDDDIEFALRLGRLEDGVPLLGTDGVLLSGQTFDQHPESVDTRYPAKIVNGWLEAGPMPARLPIIVFGEDYSLDVQNAYIRAEVTFDGGLANGVMGGGVPLTNIKEIAEKADGFVGADISAIVDLLLVGIADLEPDETGQCTQMSAALSFSAVSAFLRDAPPGS